jgi:hypothetical protein
MEITFFEILMQLVFTYGHIDREVVQTIIIRSRNSFLKAWKRKEESENEKSP